MIKFIKFCKTIDNNDNATIRPRITANARDGYLCAPLPVPNAKGISAIIAADAVINLGRRRAEIA